MAITRLGGANAILGIIPVANGGTGVSSSDSIGNLVKLSTVTVSGSAVSEIDFGSSIITSTYDTYYFTMLLHPTTDNAAIDVRLSDGGSFNSGGSDYGYGFVVDDGNGTHTNTSNTIALCDQQDTGDATNFYQGTLTLLNPQNSSVKTNVTYHGNRNDGNPNLCVGGGQRNTAEANDGIRFLASAGNLDVGSRIVCYGIK